MSYVLDFDPNRPPNLAIEPSRSSLQQVGWSTLRREIDEAVVASQAKAISDSGIAGKVWQAAGALVKVLVEGDGVRTWMETVRPASRLTVLELGSGTGYCGLHLAATLSEDDLVMVTDLDEVCLQTLGPNVVRIRELMQKHGAHGASIEVMPLAWGEQGHIIHLRERLAKQNRQVDLIIFSDLTYFPQLYKPLLSTLLALTMPLGTSSSPLPPPPPPVLCSWKTRALHHEQDFWQSFGEHFAMQVVPHGHADDEEGDIHVFWAKRQETGSGGRAQCEMMLLGGLDVND